MILPFLEIGEGVHTAGSAETMPTVMRNIVLYYQAQSGIETEKLLSDVEDPNREAFLQRFADQEGRRYLVRFWSDYKGA